MTAQNPIPIAPAEKAAWLDKIKSATAMAYGLAHDYNNYLAAIAGNNEIILRQAQPGTPAFVHAEQVDLAGRMALDLTMDMSAFSGRLGLAPVTVDMAKILQDTITAIRETLSKKIDVQFACPATSIPKIPADKDWASQAIRRVLENAAESFGGKPGAVHVTLARKTCNAAYLAECFAITPPDAGEYVCVEISDQGCGIAAKHLLKIFDPFFSTKLRRTGMGLPVAFGVMCMHRGAIHVATAPGEGTVIQMIFPEAPAPC
jgi:two-component system cell cycle sensor histidine kinase/response regulator CckA